MWLHASPTKFAQGHMITSPAQRNVPPRSWGDSLAHAVALGQYTVDRVYIFDSEGVPAREHRGRFTFTGPSDYIYEVEPLGELEQDPDRTALPIFRCCVSARVIRCLGVPRLSRAEP